MMIVIIISREAICCFGFQFRGKKGVKVRIFEVEVKLFKVNIRLVNCCN